MHVLGIDWSLAVHYREKSFAGRVTIQFENASDPLTIDAARLEIMSATLDGRPVAWRNETARGELIFEGVSSDPHRLEITYRGKVDPEGLVGFYAAPAGPQYVLTTMFFPTGSRCLLRPSKTQR